MNPFLKEECLSDYKTTQSLIQDNQLLKINQNDLKYNVVEEHKKEL